MDFVTFKYGKQKQMHIDLQKHIINKELQTDLNTHGTKINGAQFFIHLQKEDND